MEPVVKSEILPHPDAPPEPKAPKPDLDMFPLPPLPEFPFSPPPPQPDISDTATALLISFTMGAIVAGALAYSFSKKNCNGCPL